MDGLRHERGNLALARVLLARGAEHRERVCRGEKCVLGVELPVEAHRVVGACRVVAAGQHMGKEFSGHEGRHAATVDVHSALALEVTATVGADDDAAVTVLASTTETVGAQPDAVLHTALQGSHLHRVVDVHTALPLAAPAAIGAASAAVAELAAAEAVGTEPAAGLRSALQSLHWRCIAVVHTALTLAASAAVCACDAALTSCSKDRAISEGILVRP